MSTILLQLPYFGDENGNLMCYVLSSFISDIEEAKFRRRKNMHEKKMIERWIKEGGKDCQIE